MARHSQPRPRESTRRPALAGPRPPFIYRPAHYLKQFHAAYADPDALAALIKKRRMRGWAPLHNSQDNLYDMDNPALPTLQPWVNTIRPPAQQFVFVRNAFFHRVDKAGNQLPYIDRVLMNISDGKLIPAKASAGEIDLQARNLFMSHFTFLKQSEKQEGFRTLLWDTALGARIALYPNLHIADPEWRKIFRNRDFRHALSLAIDREEINEVIYFGLATPSNNTVLPQSPLFREEFQTKWADFDLARASIAAHIDSKEFVPAFFPSFSCLASRARDARGAARGGIRRRETPLQRAPSRASARRARRGAALERRAVRCSTFFSSFATRPRRPRRVARASQSAEVPSRASEAASQGRDAETKRHMEA